MIRLTTESGAIYHLDVERRRVTRTGPHSPGIDYDTVPDDAWHDLVAWSTPTVGESLRLRIVGGKFRTTTPVTTIEENDL